MTDAQPIDDALFAALVDDALDARASARLIALLRDNAGAQDAYLDYLEAHASLVWHLTDVASESAPKAVAAPASGRRRLTPFAYAAAALLLIGIGLALYGAYTGAGGVAPTPPDREAMVGTVVRSEGLVVGDGPLDSGDSFGPQTIETASGDAEFMLTSGTRLELAAGSRLTIRDPMSAALDEGEARFDCPSRAVGYTVHLPQNVRVVDLGTRFRVWAQPSGEVGVSVLEGRVEVYSESADRPVRRDTVGEGMTWTIGADERVSMVRAVIPLTPVGVSASEHETAYGELFVPAHVVEAELFGEFATAEGLADATVSSEHTWATASLQGRAVRATLTIDLGRDYELAGLLLWNYNHPPEAAWANGVESFVVTTASEAEGPGALDGEPDPTGPVHRARMASSGVAEPAQRFDLSPVRARYVRLTVLTNHGGDRIGLSELRVLGRIPGDAASAEGPDALPRTTPE